MANARLLNRCLLVGILGVASCSSSNSSTTSGAGGSSSGGAGPAGVGGSSSGGGDTGAAGAPSTTGTGGHGGTTGAGGATGGAGGAAPTGAGASAGTAGSGSVGTGGNGAADGGPSGTCASGTGSPFPVLTSYTANDGGFGPALVTRRTGDASLGTDATGAANTVAIFRPAAAKYGQGGVRHPLIVWGNGHTNTVDIWQSFLARVATYGFVVVAPEQTEVTSDEMSKAIDYVLSLANDPSSGDCGKIDTTKIGSTGYSLGGIGAITVGADARITSTFVFASNGSVKNLKAPWGVIGGDADTTFPWTAINTAVTGSAQPAFGAALAGIDHNQVAGQPKAQQAYIAWMRWRFMGDRAGHDTFVGTSCQICSDTAFSGVVKTASFDSL